MFKNLPFYDPEKTPHFSSCFNHSNKDSIQLEVSNNKKETFSYKVISMLNNSKKNDAEVSLHKCAISSTKKSNANDGLILLTNFIPLYEQKYKKIRYMYDTRPPTEKEINARLSEFLDTLQCNMNHAAIKTIYVFVETKSTLEYIHSLDLQNSHKLVIQLSNETVTLKTYLTYAPKCLLNKVIIIGHQDIVFGRGWGSINFNIMSSKRLLYAITRQPSLSGCYYSKLSANCGPSSEYLGSHDVFVFYVRDIFTSEVLALMEMKQYLNGIENILIWVFKEKLKYTVLNPCKVLYAHHQHCVPLRDIKRKRLNSKKNTGTATFSDKLS